MALDTDVLRNFISGQKRAEKSSIGPHRNRRLKRRALVGPTGVPLLDNALRVQRKSYLWANPSHPAKMASISKSRGKSREFSSSMTSKQRGVGEKLTRIFPVIFI